MDGSTCMCSVREQEVIIYILEIMRSNNIFFDEFNYLRSYSYRAGETVWGFIIQANLPSRECKPLFYSIELVIHYFHFAAFWE